LQLAITITFSWEFLQNMSFSSNNRPRLLSSQIMVRDAVLAGAGAGVLPPSLIRQELERGLLHEIGTLADSEVEVWLLYSSRRHVSSRLRVFSDLLLEIFPDARMI
jgi:DNA-binding transcriptional LysR family regulator